MKRVVIYFLLVLNAFLISYAYGLNSIRVKVVDHSLPALKPPATTEPAKPPAKKTPETTKSPTAKVKSGTAAGAKQKHPTTNHSKKAKVSDAANRVDQIANDDRKGDVLEFLQGSRSVLTGYDLNSGN